MDGGGGGDGYGGCCGGDVSGSSSDGSGGTGNGGNGNGPRAPMECSNAPNRAPPAAPLPPPQRPAHTSVNAPAHTSMKAHTPILVEARLTAAAFQLGAAPLDAPALLRGAARAAAEREASSGQVLCQSFALMVQQLR